MHIRSNLIDIHNRRIYPAEIHVEGGRIKFIKEISEKLHFFILPGFVDAHIHIESSMVTPLAFSQTAVMHGTVGTVSDPHEIANVMGAPGVEFMIENARNTPMKIMFGAPSCVPATPFESSGAEIGPGEITRILEMPEVGYLSEMMNYPGVINEDPLVWDKLHIARKMNVPIDGHAPGIRGEELKKYVAGGISTDHECFTYEEAVEKISHGMKILIREGSGAKNFPALVPLLKEYPEKIMFCSDDLHPDDLIKGHINLLVKRALDAGYDLFDVIRAAGLNAVNHYNLDVGMLRVNEPADFIEIDSLENWKVLKTYINGEAIFENGEVNIALKKFPLLNKFIISKIQKKEFEIPAKAKNINVIKAIDGELITKREIHKARVVNGNVVSDPACDILKITVVNRYTLAKPALGFIKGFGLKRGALASSIAHDSHNIICVGNTDQEIAETVNWIIKHKGGVAAHDGKRVIGLPLEVGGIMSKETTVVAASGYSELSGLAREIGSNLKAPFMTLAFMALLVIPELKLSDKGLFDGLRFSFTSLFVDEK